jgi:hypothetical protein
VRLFHGTGHAATILAEGFDLEAPRHDPGDFGHGVYLTDSLGRAKSYGEPLEIRVDVSRYARIPCPYFLDGLTALEPSTAPERLFHALAFPEGSAGPMATVKGQQRTATAHAIRDAFLAAGYAGIIAGPDDRDQREVVVFDLSTIEAIEGR